MRIINQVPREEHIMNYYFRPHKSDHSRIAFKMFAIGKRRGVPDYVLEVLLELFEHRLPLEVLHRTFLKILH